MEDAETSESHLISAAAYVEAGLQDACEDACSICLEVFSESEPSTMTNCKHEFHLQCILEWCQRSSQCPMCWQPISLKDPESQGLLDAVEHERHIMSNPPRTATIFRHPTLGEFEIPVGVTDVELEERIIQHLAAAAMRRGRHIVRREGRRSRPSAYDHPHFLFSSSSDTSPARHSMQFTSSNGGESEHTSIMSPSSVVSEENLSAFANSPQPDEVSTPSSGSGGTHTDETGSSNRRSPVSLSPICQDREGSSEGQSFSETVKSRFTAVSTKYKESIAKSTRGWKERLFSRNTCVADLGSEVKREVNVGLATAVTRMMDRLGTKDNETSTSASSVLPTWVDEAVQSLRNPPQAVEITGTAGVNGTHLPSPCAPPSV